MKANKCGKSRLKKPVIRRDMGELTVVHSLCSDSSPFTASLVTSDEMTLEELKQTRLYWKDPEISHNKQMCHRTRFVTARN